MSRRLPTFSLFGAPASFTYDVTRPSMTEGEHTFSGTLRSGDPPADSTVGGDTMVTVAAETTDPDPMPMTRTASSVDARPKDPGDLAQITVKFETSMFLAIDESITLEVSDDFGVPSSISASDVSISGMGAESATARQAPSLRLPVRLSLKPIRSLNGT